MTPQPNPKMTSASITLFRGFVTALQVYDRHGLPWAPADVLMALEHMRHEITEYALELGGFGVAKS